MNFNEKQLQILNTAEELFAEKGFDGTSVRDIAEAAAVNVAMISYYFGSKEKLMEALFIYRTGDVKLRVTTLMDNDSISPWQKVGSLIDDHIERAIEKKRFYRIIQREQLIETNPSIAKAIIELKKTNIAAVTELIKDGQKKGVFKKKIDVLMMLNTLIGTVSQTMNSKYIYKDIMGYNDLPEEEFLKQLKRKLSIHLHTLVKSIITHEA